MTQLSDNRIIAPPIEEEVYPYRRVWRSIIIQTLLMTIISSGVVLIGEIFGLQFNSVINTLLSYSLALIPPLLWVLISVAPERFVQEPRPNLVIVFVISSLAASALGIPIVHNIFRIDEWLPLESALQRILGFAFTMGIVDTAIKFIIVRYFVFPQHLRIRLDTVAYCVASAMGYSTVVNLYTLSEIPSVYSISIIYIFANYVIQLTSSLFIAYGLSETYFNDAFPIIMPVNIVIASFIVGFISPFVTGLMNGPLVTTGNADRPIFSLGFLIAVLFAFIGIAIFFYNVAERREREAFAADES